MLAHEKGNTHFEHKKQQNWKKKYTPTIWMSTSAMCSLTLCKHEYLNKVNRFLLLFAFSISLEFFFRSTCNAKAIQTINHIENSISSYFMLQNGFKSAHVNTEAKSTRSRHKSMFNPILWKSNHKWNETTRHEIYTKYTPILYRMYRCGNWKLKLVLKVFDFMRMIDLPYRCEPVDGSQFQAKTVFTQSIRIKFYVVVATIL